MDLANLMFSRFTTIAVSPSGRCFLAMHSALQGSGFFYLVRNGKEGIKDSNVPSKKKKEKKQKKKDD